MPILRPLLALAALCIVCTGPAAAQIPPLKSLIVTVADSGDIPGSCTAGQSPVLYDRDAATFHVCTGGVYVAQAVGSDVSIDGTSVASPNFTSTGDVDFSNAAGTVTADLNTGAILDADINASAAIALSKLAEDILAETELDTFAEAQTQVADKTLVNEEDAATIDSAWTFSSGLSGALTGNADTATALAANPGDCTDSGSYAYQIAASGALTCQTLTRTTCATIPNLASDDDGFVFWAPGSASTVASVGCRYTGTAVTVAQVSLEDAAGNAMTHTTPTCVTTSTAMTYQNVTASGGLTAGEGLAFDVDNIPDGDDTYTICVKYTED